MNTLANLLLNTVFNLVGKSPSISQLISNRPISIGVNFPNGKVKAIKIAKM